MNFDQLFNSLSEAYPMAPNPNTPQTNQPAQYNQQTQPNQPTQPNNTSQPATNNSNSKLDPTVVDELVKANNPQAVLQILQQKLGVK